MKVLTPRFSSSIYPELKYAQARRLDAIDAVETAQDAPNLISRLYHGSAKEKNIQICT